MTYPLASRAVTGLMSAGDKERLDGLVLWAGTAGGTANALTVTTGAGLTALRRDMVIGLRATAANTGATTLTVDGLTAEVRRDGVALAGGEFQPNMDARVQYDGTCWRFMGSGLTIKSSGVHIGGGVTSLDFVLGTGSVSVSGALATITINLPPWRYLRVEALTPSHLPRPPGSTYFNDYRGVGVYLTSNATGTNWALGKTATASATAPEYGANDVLDGNPTTRWANPLGDTSPPWLQIDFGASGLPQAPGSVTIYPADSVTAAYIATQLRLGLSRDSIGWVWTPAYATASTPGVTQVFNNLTFS
ncbi:hypothetical protein M2352_003937 [Azospirillum fermentarium]|uniref:discoidin domain-containing protein n=1 Tax=Azospirillum fermentarium TaxID=1233114 RepID=UPI00222628D1|nr:discoidin domain-containing protein [Azospirillum fermentarium]MCW2248303.1 hypothetical protein [Azospirillum fermentarium]